MENYTFVATRDRGPGVRHIEDDVTAEHAEILPDIERRCAAVGDGEWSVEILGADKSKPCFTWRFALPRKPVVKQPALF